MSDEPTIAYAYIAEVRETLETCWEPHTILVTLPGAAPRNLLDVIEEGMEDLIRIKRITDAEIFVSLVGLNVKGLLPLLMDENFDGEEEIEFIEDNDEV